jgi:hypothetical protein
MRSVFDKIYGSNNLCEFVGTIKEVAKYGGISEAAFYKCETNGVQYIVKMSPYLLSTPELYNVPVTGTINTVDTEINILRLFKRVFINRGATPCIVEMVYNNTHVLPESIEPPSNADSVVTEKYQSFNDTIGRFRDLSKKGLMHPKIAFIIIEKCDVTLRQYLMGRVKTPIDSVINKSIIFFVAHALFVITQKYPQFKHGDLHSENVLLKVDPRHSQFITKRNPYCVLGGPNGKKYYVPYFGVYPKIIDFSFSSVPEEGIISVTKYDKMISATREEGDFSYLLSYLTFDEPSLSDLHERAQLSGITLEDILDDKLFAEYLTPIADGTKVNEYNI